MTKAVSGFAVKLGAQSIYDSIYDPLFRLSKQLKLSLLCVDIEEVSLLKTSVPILALCRNEGFYTKTSELPLLK